MAYPFWSAIQRFEKDPRIAELHYRFGPISRLMKKDKVKAESELRGFNRLLTYHAEYLRDEYPELFKIQKLTVSLESLQKINFSELVRPYNLLILKTLDKQYKTLFFVYFSDGHFCYEKENYDSPLLPDEFILFLRDHFISASDFVEIYGFSAQELHFN